MSSKTEAKSMPAFHVAFLRHVGPYHEIGAAFGKIAGWAGAKGLIGPGAQFLGIYHDDPSQTPAAELRSDACLVVPEGTEVDGDVQLGDIPSGLYAVLRGEVLAEEIKGLWDGLVPWIQANGYQWDDRPCYELYHNDHETHPEKKFIMDVCGAIKQA